MPLRTIAVFFDPSPAGEARADYAVKLAFRHRAHLVGIFVVPFGWDGNPSESFVRGQAAVRELIQRHAASELAATKAASQSFAAVSSREDISYEFRFLRSGEANDESMLNALHSDLVIVGSPRSGGLPQERSAESLLLAAGVPILLLPDHWRGTAAEHIVIGWNASREARRAIADALPLLAAAQSVTVLLVDSHKNARHGQEPGADVGLYLSRHGVKVAVERIQSNGAPVADAILGFAKRHASDLIAVGAYSHARTAQMIFGGVTRALLRDATVPLLLAH
ncbi:universal stress protein [Bradyrhizobium sp. BRP22]|uniref:universal stress protein n=1 Tax=Bradyrhizobium sp. BRP22 TaxID=2793821 RepID=UPI001CD5DBC6|nr:universal stress protein [Bradyrhizobium sp. BRP22]